MLKREEEERENRAEKQRSEEKVSVEKLKDVEEDNIIYKLFIYYG